MTKINNFVATLDELLRFLESYEEDLFYFDIDPSIPPEGARQFAITTFPDEVAMRVMDEIHPGVSLPRMTPSAQKRVEAAIPPFECGMNIQPKDGLGYPIPDPNMESFAWVRYPLQASPARFPSVTAALDFYAPIIDAYNNLGVKTILVLTHEFYGEGLYVWDQMNPDKWAQYTEEYATALIPALKRFGDRVAAYEVWNEGDVDIGNEAAVAFPATDYAPFLKRMTSLIRQYAPKAQVVMGGLVHSPGRSAKYIRVVRQNLGGELPIDAVGIHPYGKGAPNDTTVFSRLGDIDDDIRQYIDASGGVPLWLTEVGALGTDDPNYWDDAAQYIRTLYTYLREKQAHVVQNAMWYAWSDAMHPSQKTNGLVTKDGQKKPHVYDAFMEIACTKT